MLIRCVRVASLSGTYPRQMGLMSAAGRMVFHGPRQEILPYFSTVGFQPPERKNPADFVQEVSCIDMLSLSGSCLMDLNTTGICWHATTHMVSASFCMEQSWCQDETLPCAAGLLPQRSEGKLWFVGVQQPACGRLGSCCSLTGLLNLLLLQQYWIRQEGWSFVPVRQLAEQFMQSDLYQESMQASHWYACWRHYVPNGCGQPALRPHTSAHCTACTQAACACCCLALNDDDDDDDMPS